MLPYHAFAPFRFIVCLLSNVIWILLYCWVYNNQMCFNSLLHFGIHSTVKQVFVFNGVANLTQMISFWRLFLIGRKYSCTTSMKSCIFSHKVYPDRSPTHLACLREHFAPLVSTILLVLPLIWGPWGWATPFSLHLSAPTQAPTHLLLCVLKHFIFKDRWPRNTDFIKYPRFSVGEMEVWRSKWTEAVTQTFCWKCFHGRISLLAAVNFLLLTSFL